MLIKLTSTFIISLNECQRLLITTIHLLRIEKMLIILILVLKKHFSIKNIGI